MYPSQHLLLTCKQSTTCSLYFYKPNTFARETGVFPSPLACSSASSGWAPPRGRASLRGIAPAFESPRIVRRHDASVKKLLRIFCRERDSNPHALRRTILSRLRLPIPPSRHLAYNTPAMDKKQKILALTVSRVPDQRAKREKNA